MGGIVGDANQCLDYNKKWDRLLKKHGLAYFHSKRLRSSSGEFENWSDHSKSVLIREIDKLQNNNSLFRFVTVVRKDEFQEHYKGGESTKDAAVGFDIWSVFSSFASLSFTVELSSDRLAWMDNRS